MSSFNRYVTRPDLKDLNKPHCSLLTLPTRTAGPIFFPSAVLALCSTRAQFLLTTRPPPYTSILTLGPNFELGEPRLPQAFIQFAGPILTWLPSYLLRSRSEIRQRDRRGNIYGSQFFRILRTTPTFFPSAQIPSKNAGFLGRPNNSRAQF